MFANIVILRVCANIEKFSLIYSSLKGIIMNDIAGLLEYLKILCLDVSYLLIVEIDDLVHNTENQNNDDGHFGENLFEKSCEDICEECQELMVMTVNSLLPNNIREEIVCCLNDIAQALFQLPDLLDDLTALEFMDDQVAEDVKLNPSHNVFYQLTEPEGEVIVELITKHHIENHKNLINRRLVCLDNIITRYHSS